MQLVLVPSAISPMTFVTVIHMLVVMCANCPDLAVVLLKQSKFTSLIMAYFSGTAGMVLPWNLKQSDEIRFVMLV